MKNRFLILMMAGLLVFLPGCEYVSDAVEYAVDEVKEVIEEAGEDDDEDDEDWDDEDEDEDDEDWDDEDEDDDEDWDDEDEDEDDEDEDDEDLAEVNIPMSAISGEKFMFKTKTIDGVDMGSDIFSGYDLTIVHVWGTFCGPCIAGMDEYAYLYEDLPSNVNLVAIVCDATSPGDSTVSRAHDILDDSEAEFMNLCVSADMGNVLDALNYVPSSFFVDRNGNIIGQVMDGANIDDTMEQLEEYVDY